MNTLINNKWINVLKQLRDQIIELMKELNTLELQKIDFFEIRSKSFEASLARECNNKHQAIFNECATFDNNKTIYDFRQLLKQFDDFMSQIKEVPDIKCVKDLKSKIMPILTDSQQREQLKKDPAKQAEMNKLITDRDTLRPLICKDGVLNETALQCS